MRRIAPHERNPDAHKGALEGDRVDDEQQGNPNAPALDEAGRPENAIAMAEDRIGANIDDAEVANADESGRTTDAEREELEPLE
jgi:hypothetical protein